MIRINLLERRKAPKPAFEFGQQVPALASLILVAALLFIGWRFWSLRQESARLDADIVHAQQETARLEPVLEEVARFEQRKGQLQQRVALIEELRRGQSAPVHLLDEISRAIPDRLWLADLKSDVNGALMLEGRTTSLTALSDLVGNLESSGYFTRPVEIMDSQVETVKDAGDQVKFTVKAQFLMPGMSAPAAAAPALKPGAHAAAAARPASAPGGGGRP